MPSRKTICKFIVLLHALEPRCAYYNFDWVQWDSQCNQVGKVWYPWGQNATDGCIGQCPVSTNALASQSVLLSLDLSAISLSQCVCVCVFIWIQKRSKWQQPTLQTSKSRIRMANWALECPIIILITARSFYSYINILIIIQHPWTILTKNSAS